jgi:hypothetical protein
MGKNKPPRGISNHEKSSMNYAIYELVNIPQGV